MMDVLPKDQLCLRVFVQRVGATRDMLMPFNLPLFKEVTRASQAKGGANMVRM